jgi:HEAT repeat protein
LVVLAALAAYSWLFQDQSESARITRSLLASLDSKDPLERGDAAFELGAMRLRGEEVTEAVPALVDGLCDADKGVRQAAAEALCSFGKAAAPAVPALARVLRECPRDLRLPALRILGGVGSQEASLLLEQNLADPASEIRLDTVTALGTCGPLAGMHVPHLLEMLRSDPDVRVREEAFNSVWLISPNTEQVTQARLLALRDRSATIRKTAMYCLWTAPSDPAPFVATFRAFLHDPDAAVRNEAIQGLRRIGLRQPTAMEGLCDALADRGTHDGAREAIAQMYFFPTVISSAAAAAIPPLVQAMKNGDAATAGIISALLCKTEAEWDLKKTEVPQSLRDSQKEILARVREHDRRFRRYVLGAELVELPNEDRIALIGELAEEIRSRARADAQRARDDSWRAALENLRARTQRGETRPQTKLLVEMLPADLVHTFVPEICAALDDEDASLRIVTLSVVGYLLRGEQRSLLASSPAAMESVVHAFCLALSDHTPWVNQWAGLLIQQFPAIRSEVEARLHQRSSFGKSAAGPR